MKIVYLSMALALAACKADGPVAPEALNNSVAVKQSLMVDEPEALVSANDVDDPNYLPPELPRTQPNGKPLNAAFCESDEGVQIYDNLKTCAITACIVTKDKESCHIADVFATELGPDKKSN